jgi:hypothetical protein
MVTGRLLVSTSWRFSSTQRRVTLPESITVDERDWDDFRRWSQGEGNVREEGAPVAEVSHQATGPPNSPAYGRVSFSREGWRLERHTWNLVQKWRQRLQTLTSIGLSI